MFHVLLGGGGWKLSARCRVVMQWQTYGGVHESDPVGTSSM